MHTVFYIAAGLFAGAITLGFVIAGLITWAAHGSPDVNGDVERDAGMDESSQLP
jgi:hypothetical protein